MNFDATHPSEEFLRAIDIHTLLPQQEPFVMIEALVHFEPKRIETESVIDADNIFVEDGRFSAFGLIENIAQTCAARIGYANKYILKKDVQIGFIGAIKNLTIFELPKTDDLIRTKVDVLEEVFGMTLAKAEVICGGRTLITAEMKIAIEQEETTTWTH